MQDILVFFIKGIARCISDQRRKCSNITTQCTKETCIYRKNNGKTKEKKLPAINKIVLELLHKRLRHRSARSLLDGGTDTFWEYVELIIDPDPFCTSCQISSMDQKSRYKKLLKPNAPFKWVLWI